jgi:hypothetical protein
MIDFAEGQRDGAVPWELQRVLQYASDNRQPVAGQGHPPDIAEAGWLREGVQAAFVKACFIMFPPLSKKMNMKVKSCQSGCTMEEVKLLFSGKTTQIKAME